MHRLRFTVLLLALLPLVAATAESATRTPTVFSSESGQGEERGGYIALAGGGISLNQAISMVERRFKARVVRSDVRQEGDRKIYVLRLLDDSGNAQVVRVDASSGQIM